MAENGVIIGRASSHNSLEDNLELNFDELDDSEYDIPPVDKAPTLESILNDIDDQCSLSEDELASLPQIAEGGSFGPEAVETLSVGSRGSWDTRSRCSSERSRRRRSPGGGFSNRPVQPPSSLLRHLILRGVSQQMSSARERVNAGLPTSIAASTMIAVGTSHGLVLVFDSSQTLRWCLGAEEGSHSGGCAGSNEVSEFGAVSALSLNHDCSRLLVGFAKGAIFMYDLTCGRLLRTLSDAHPPATAVLHLKFTDSPTLALCADSGGSVFELSFKRTMGVRGCDSRCLFSGSRGEVVALEPLLLLNRHPAQHPLREVIAVAMATLSKVIVVTIRPRMRVVFTHSLHSSNPSTLPLLAWQFVVIQAADGSRVIDPVLAFARESTIHFFQMSPDMRGVDGNGSIGPFGGTWRIRMIPLRRLVLPHTLIALHWLDVRTLAVIDSLERVHLLDVRTREELESLDVSDVRLVYGTSHFKGLATGGNVSQAMVLAGERACYNSVLSFGNQLLLLGTNSFHVLTIRSWSDRLSHLMKQGRHLDALALGMTFLEDSGRVPVFQRKKGFVREKLLEILGSYIDEVVTPVSSCGDSSVDGENSVEECIITCIQYCIVLSQKELLFDKVWDIVQAVGVAKACYLEGLEPYFLNDQLQFVPPDIMQQFVAHYESQGLFQALEACLLHVDVGSLDVHQVVTLCWTHGMYDALLYIHNRGMADYVTPFEELMAVLREALSKGKQLGDAQIALGNKLLVYVSCCLAGRAYPTGEVAEELVAKVKREVFQCLTSVHSKDAGDTEPPYPYLRTLMQFDMREFLNVLSLAFEEPEFTSELGLRQRQRVVDILLQVVVLGEGFLPSQVGSLFTFLARQMAKPSPSLPTPTLSPFMVDEPQQAAPSLQVESKLFERVVEYLAGADGNEGSIGQHEERQQALLELFGAGGLDHYDPERLLELCLKAKFFRVCELLYEQRRDYKSILSCYLQDPLRKHQVYSYLQNALISQQISLQIEPEIVENIKELVDIDSKKAGQLLALQCPYLMPRIIEKLKDSPAELYQLLMEMFHCKAPSGESVKSIVCDDLPTVDPVLHERLLTLMCSYEPKRVKKFLETVPGFRLDEALKITQTHKVMDATAYVLELMGDVQGAFDILIKQLQSSVEIILAPLCAGEDIGSSEFEIPNEIICEVRENVISLVDLCRRGSNLLDDTTRETLWMSLLEGLLAPQRRLQKVIASKEGGGNSNPATDLLHVFKELTHSLLSSMVGLTSLPKVIHAVMKDPAYRGGKFGEIRGLLIDVLENCSQEKAMLATTGRLLGQDLHDQLVKLLAASRRGVRPLIPPHYVSKSDVIPPLCSKCCSPLDEIADEGSIIVMRCGHCYHDSCLGNCLGSAAVSPKCIHCMPDNQENEESEDSATYHLTRSCSSSSGRQSGSLTLEQIHSVEMWFELRKSAWREGALICSTNAAEWSNDYSPARVGMSYSPDYSFGETYD
ncbi:vacuolar protein sorting-associated protein 8 homolog isoform X2 [Ischnura elegans]|uniref:vacuolar protein sorting-associated protein 8 homolog isoform X2 n=1 Tax=Ischnura elegans TaxID=197161 RepID=UPI001ED89334|nr:vacuolar protein sorting-associated protein 8 homolog isoform X2 [Ischnura elegans]